MCNCTFCHKISSTCQPVKQFACLIRFEISKKKYQYNLFVKKKTKTVTCLKDFRDFEYEVVKNLHFLLYKKKKNIIFKSSVVNLYIKKIHVYRHPGG